MSLITTCLASVKLEEKEVYCKLYEKEHFRKIAKASSF